MKRLPGELPKADAPLTSRRKLGHLNEQSLYSWEKGFANQIVPRFREDMHSRVSGNLEAPQKTSAFARRHVPTIDVRSEAEGWT